MRFEQTGALSQTGYQSSSYVPDSPIFAQNRAIGASPLSSAMASLKMSAMVLAFASSVAFATDSALANAICPEGSLAIPVVVRVESATVACVVVKSAELRAAQSQLVASIKTEPVEDGFLHPAELTMNRIVNQFTAIEIHELVFDDVLRQSPITASLIQLLGRIDSLQPALRQSIITTGLASDRVDIRDAVVQAAELWGDPAAITLFQNHKEQVGWLENYINHVVRDLGA